MAFVYLIITILIGKTSTETRCSKRCDYDNLGRGRCYNFIRIPATWHEAQLRCHFQGATLFTPYSTKDSDIFAFYLNKYEMADDKIYTGVHATFSHGDFHSIEGIPLRRIRHFWKTEGPISHDSDYKCISWERRRFVLERCNKRLPYICYIQDGKPRNEKCGTDDKAYEYNEDTGSCYKFHPYVRSWSRAYMKCWAEQGHLVIVNSEKEAEQVRSLFKKFPEGSIMPSHIVYQSVAHAGFLDWGEHSAWNWRTAQGTGENLDYSGYTKWAPDEPRNSSGEFCGAIERSGELDDFNCYSPVAFICEKSPQFDATCGDRLEQTINELRPQEKNLRFRDPSSAQMDDEGIFYWDEY